MTDVCGTLFRKTVSLLLSRRQFNHRKLLIAIKVDCNVEMVEFSEGSKLFKPPSSSKVYAH